MNQNTAEISPLKKWGSLVVLSLALAIIVIDTTLLNVSLGTIIKELNTDIQSLQWVITAYALTLAALTITGGRLGDLFGRKLMFMMGAVIFAIGSLIASFSNNIPTLLAGESIIEGIGAALMMPATASLLVANFRGRERAIAFGVWGGIAAAASAIGPILGGYLTTNYSWRWGFRINVVVTAILLIGSFLIKESRDREEKPDLDLVGVVLSGLGMLGVIFGIIESPTYGWIWAKKDFYIGETAVRFGELSIVPITLVLGIVLLLVFLDWEKRVERMGKTPLVSLKIFKNRQFNSGVLTTAVLSLSQTGIIFALPVFLQAVRGYDAFRTGLALLPLSLSILFSAPFSAFLSHKITPRLIIQAGVLCNIVSAIMLSLTLTTDTQSADLVIPLVIYGTGMGLIMGQVSNITLSAVSVEQAGEASGLNSTFRQVGSSLGSAIIGAVILTSVSSNLNNYINESAIIPNQVKPTVQEVVKEQSANIEFGGEQRYSPTLPQYMTEELSNLVKKATTQSNKDAFLYTFFFAILVLITSFTLPNTKNLEKNQSAH